MCGGTATLIDHLYVSNAQQYHHWGVLNPGLSDHCLIYTCRKKAKLCKEKEFRVIRCYSHFNPEMFTHELKNIDWSPVYAELEVDPAVDVFT